MSEGHVCCLADCGGCGGVGCSTRTGSATATNCCISDITTTGSACSDTNEAPCFITAGKRKPSQYSGYPQCDERSISQLRLRFFPRHHSALAGFVVCLSRVVLLGVDSRCLFGTHRQRHQLLHPRHHGKGQRVLRPCFIDAGERKPSLACSLATTPPPLIVYFEVV